MNRKTILFLILILLAIMLLPQAEKPENRDVREANFKLARQFTESRLRDLLRDTSVDPNWIEGGLRFWYRFQTFEETRFVVVDPVKKSSFPLFDRRQLAKVLSAAVDKPVDFRNLPIDGVRFDDQQHQLRFSLEGRQFIYHIQENRLEPEPVSEKEAERAETGTFSPDGKWLVYSRNHNLFIRESTGTSRAIPLTADGALFYDFDPSDYDYVDAEKRDYEIPVEAFVVWSPDSKKFIALRTDARQLKPMPVMNSLATPRPEVVTYRVSLPDEPLRTYEIWLYNLNARKIVKVEAEKWPAQEYGDFTWSRDATRLYLTRRSRDQLRCDLLAVNPETGGVRVIIEERNAGMILTQPVFELPDDRGLIWFSRRDGNGHYFLIDPNGNLKKQITRGRFNAAGIISVNSKAETIYFLANGDNGDGNPYYLHFYKAGIENGRISRLTAEEADHRIHLSPDRSCFVDNFSRADRFPGSVLKDMDGNPILHLETADTSRLEQAGWKMPKVFREKAADGRTDIWAIMWLPFDLNPAKRYPVITFVYPGPQDEFVPWQFFGRPENTHLAQYGFIVLMYGNRGGSQVRSLAYSEQYRGNLRDFGIDDKKAVIEQLGLRFPFMDLNRVGIWGGSSGGFMTVTAMLLYPDFFRVGVSRSGIQDPALVYRWWGDSFQGMRETGDENGDTIPGSVKVPSNLEIAGKLKGRLLLIQGEADTIVHPANAMRLADALMGLNKRFDFILVPGGGHGASPHWPYIKNRVWLYFIENLMGDLRFMERVDLSEFMGDSR